MSFMFDFFFSGLINKIIENNGWQNEIAIIYSGGDDLFLVGNWNTICSCAMTINSEFSKFTGNNESITLSAGIYLAAHKYPIYKSADGCAEYEERAKQYCVGNEDLITSSKNAVTFLSMPVKWSDFEIINNFKNLLVANIKNENISKGLLNKLREIFELYTEIKNELKKDKTRTKEEIERLAMRNKWQWKMAYFLHRAAQSDKKESKEIIEKIENIILQNDDDFDTKVDFISLLGMPARWAEFETRK